MSNLQIVPKNELMGVIEIDGRKYITTQRLHAEKRAAGMDTYVSVSEFNRAIKDLTTYSDMLELGHVKYVTKENVQSFSTDAELAPVLISNGYNPLLLIDPTAQQTIEQHLNDEQSKISSLGANALSASVKTGDLSAGATATSALGAQGINPHAMMAQMNTLYAEYCRLEIEAAKSAALVAGLDKSLTGSQRNNAKLTRQNKELIADNYKLNLQATGQLSHMSVAQFCAAVGIKVTKDAKALARRLKETSNARGVEVKKTILGADKWPSMQFQAALMNELIDDIKSYFS